MAITLIKALYDPKASLPKEQEYYENIIEEIEYFSVSSQIYHLIKEQDKLDQVPLFFLSKLKKNYKETLYQNLFIKSETLSLLKQFEKAKVAVIPLKGVIFAEKYFGHIGARGTSDIDILIQENDLEKAIQLVKALGYTTESEYIPFHFHCSFKKQIPGAKNPLTVEIHWDILKKGTSDLKITEFWREAAPMKSYQYVMELSEQHTFYLICLHGWKHQMNSLKYFIDIIQLIYTLKDKLDYTGLFNDAATHKVLRRTIKTLTIVYQLFPQLESVIKLPVKTKSWWEYDMLKNPQFKKGKQYMNFVSFQFLDYDKICHCFVSISRWLFPSRLEVASELGSNHNNTSLLYNYFRLFQKRWKGVKAVLVKKRI